MSSLRSRPYLALIAISFLISFFNAPRYALLPVYVEADLLRSPLFSAGLRSLFLIIGGVVALFAGRLADRIGVKRVYLLGTLGPFLGGLVFLTGDPVALSALCIGIGITQGFDSAGGQSYLISAVTADGIGTASAGYFLGNTLGTAAGNALSGPIADALGYNALGAVTTAASVGLTLVALAFLPAIPVAAPPKGASTAAGSVSLALLRRPDILFLLGIRFLPTCYWGAVTLLLPILIYRITGTNTDVTTYSAVSLTVAAAFQILTGRLCDRIGRWKPIFVSAAVEAASAAGLALFSDSLAGVYLFGIIASAAAWSLSTTMPGLLQLTSREGERGRVVGLAHFAWSGGMLAGNLGAGKLLDLSPALPFWIGGIFCLGAFFCGLGLYRIHARPAA